MTTRMNAFAELDDLPDFGIKPKKTTAVAEEKIAQIAEDNNFPSRQPQKAARIQRRKPRIHRTGRNVQFNAKLTAETNVRIYKLADMMSEERGEPLALGELLKLAMDALERERAAARDRSSG